MSDDLDGSRIESNYYVASSSKWHVQLLLEGRFLQ